MNLSKTVIAHADLSDNNDSDQADDATVPDTSGELI